MQKKFRVGVIGRTGRGNYGHGLDTAWLDVPQTEVVAVADDDKSGLAAAAKRLGVQKAFTDYREMLDQVDIDIVAICSRWIDKHHEMAVAAAERGMHIYMEKPFCRTLQEADEIVAACEKTHVKMALGHPTRYSPLVPTIRNLIQSGRIGKVLEYRGRGKEDRRGGGEDLWVLGTHVMDMIRAIGGAPKWCFAQVTQDERPATKADVVPGTEGISLLAGDQVRAVYGMADGATAYFASTRNMAGRPSRYGLQILGSRGVIELVEGILPSVKILVDSSWSPGRSGKSWQEVSSAGIAQPEPLKGPEYQARHWLAILDLVAAIEEQRQPLSSVYEARGATEMILSVFESHRLGRPVTLPLENRKHPLSLLT